MGDIAKDINSKFPNNRIKAHINIRYTANWINSKESEFFKPYGISPQQYNILRILRGSGDKIKVQTVKNRMIERAPNATRLMDKLLEKNLIERTRCEEDRRVVYVNITEEGLLLLSEIDQSFNLSLLKNLTDEEAKQLSDLLDKIR
ncbi:MarR family transcriptional regulator [Tenacibaculum sp. IB213877]|jgi:MarR family 2-MHQ and catechol resistance regulon transcriptional repressor|uniref:MarR family winged helix-turn-helix transcriptional regulator n=1 Tax=Tenacibaculum sp. IB213877 TaxID=3097351 RepID=UPI002A59B3F8|nr:MarR family transcriptional regulator [Tenacibaculum sp. IB213877]MDY0779991.1 MarR family transcriptional regulator [Tenacibaculum sp. IB213877]